MELWMRGGRYDVSNEVHLKQFAVIVFALLWKLWLGGSPASFLLAGGGLWFVFGKATGEERCWFRWELPKWQRGKVYEQAGARTTLV
ncbi:hypothetical protein D5086_022640 [Populus alba]|uniref:Uncharacterized protein n=1 Tax=Populus alba TaxID=43335 RepID=A0ACC4BH07_POPAL